MLAAFTLTDTMAMTATVAQVLRQSASGLALSRVVMMRGAGEEAAGPGVGDVDGDGFGDVVVCVPASGPHA